MASSIAMWDGMAANEAIFIKSLDIASLPKIRNISDEAVRNIVDIQIAIQTLLTTTPSGYQQYIQQVSIGKKPTNPDYSFDKVITRVTESLNSVIGPDKPYFGGTFLKKGIAEPSGLGNKRPKKLSKTRKQKRTKRKTYKKRK